MPSVSNVVYGMIADGGIDHPFNWQLRTFMHTHARENGGIQGYADLHHKPEWATNRDWHQYRCFVLGKEIPSPDSIWPTLLQNENYDIHSRHGRWRYSHVPGTITGRQNYEGWCRLIEYYVDEGL